MTIYLGVRKPKDYSHTIIYKITCIPNGKVYIGQTTNSLQRRYNSHFWSNSGCLKLKRAIKKYGKENFIVDQIDYAHSKEEADAKEKAYISLYNSTNARCGYNITKGGETTFDVVCRPVICIETGMIFPSATFAAKKFNSSPSVLTSVCLGKKKMFKGYHWAYLDKKGKPLIENLDLSTKPRKIKVMCIETGEIFNSIKEASVAKNCNVAQLGQVLKRSGHCKTAAGLHWKYIDRENPKQKPISKNRKKIKIICLETGKIYDSVFECAKKIGVYRSSIYSSLYRGFSCKGLHYKFFGKED